MHKIIKIFSIILLTGIVINSLSAQGKKESLKVLFVGNSYTYFENLPHIVSLMSNSAKTKLITQKSTRGGAKLSDHWRGVTGLKSKEIISKGNFDVVVLQEHSMGILNEKDSVKMYVKLFCDLIRSKGAKPYIYLTWARENAPQNQAIISNAYFEIGKENNAEVVPVGDAWALAKQIRPEIKLFDLDGTHPSKYGTFLAACLFTKALSLSMPSWTPNSFKIEDKNNESVQLMIVDTGYVSFCRKITEKISLGQTGSNSTMKANAQVAITSTAEIQTIPTTINLADTAKRVNVTLNPVNPLWNGWKERRLIFGLKKDSVPVPVKINSQLIVPGTIMAGGSATSMMRWGYHVFEGYAADNLSRITMLVNKHTEDEKKVAEMYYYLTEYNHSNAAYGWFKLGSDVKKHSFMFSRDKQVAFGAIDCRNVFQLARINPATDLLKCTDIAEADKLYDAENAYENNAKCVLYLGLKNAVNGAMFYDTNRNKAVIKINGDWKDLATKDIPKGTYDFDK
jgi:hypothetical protein